MKIKKILCEEDINIKFINTPIETLIKYQNFKKEFIKYDNAQILVGMCMDNRKQLRLPENFAYILRTGGANIRNSEFKLSYCIAVGNIKYIALIAHNECGMVNLISKKEQFVNGLVENAGWDKNNALEHFLKYAPIFEIENEAQFVLSESRRLSIMYPNINIIPLYYTIEDNKLNEIIE